MGKIITMSASSRYHISIEVLCTDMIVVARFQHVGRKFLRLGMNKELKQMTEFCQVGCGNSKWKQLNSFAYF